MFASSISILLATFAILPIITGTSLPPPTGNYDVGVKKYTIPYVNSNDTTWPGGISTLFIATIIYPTKAKPSHRSRPYLDPVTAILYESNYQFTFNTLSSITENFLVKDAPPIKNSKFPTLVFSPGGGGPPIEVYTLLLSDLASHGYIIIATDHPYEQPFVRYPNGTGIIGLPITYPYTLPLLEGIQKDRIEDTSALLDYLPTLSKKFGAPINNTHIGAFGHSIGGAAAIGSILSDPRISSVINMDGSFWSPLDANSSAIDVKKPLLLLGQGPHDGAPVELDNWITFIRWQTGWWREILVRDSLHLDFSDTAFWKTMPPWKSSSFGTVDGMRMIGVTRAVVKAFFDFTLLGEEEGILDGPSSEWPELNYYAGGNGTA
jgi:hypothetical protein